MHRIRTLAAALIAIALGMLALASSAAAHVTVTAPGATRGGGDQEITFRVPVEKDVDTVGLTVALPTNTPIASVDVEPIADWTHTQKSARLAKPIVTDDGNITDAVSQITWTARRGQGLKPGEFGAFTIIAGQLPDSASITFRALQTYADGSVVAWNQTAAPGSTQEPDNPAPVLTLAASAKSDTTQAPATKTPTAKAASTTGPTVLSIIALVVAAAALGLAVLSRAARRAGERS